MRAAASCSRAAPKVATWRACGNSPAASTKPTRRAEAALKRELHEELGIEVELGAPADPRAAGLSAQALAPGCARRARLARYRARPGRAGAGVGAAAQAGRLSDAARRHPGRGGADATRSLSGHARSPATTMRAWLSSLERALANGVRRVQLRAPAMRLRSAGATLATQAAARCRSGRCRRAGQWRPRARAGARHGRASARGATDAAQRRVRCRRMSWSPRPATTRIELHAAQALGCDFAVLGAIKPTLTPSGRPRRWAGAALRLARNRLPADLRHWRPHARRRRRSAPTRRAGYRRDPGLVARVGGALGVDYQDVVS